MRCTFSIRCGPLCHRCSRCWQAVETDTLPIYSICRGYRGVGYHLSRMFAWVGIRPSADCKCRSRANFMDARGPEWCEEHLPEIVGWLRESAEERGLPFIEAAAALLVRRAVAAARREQAKTPPPSSAAV